MRPLWLRDFSKRLRTQEDKVAGPLQLLSSYLRHWSAFPNDARENCPFVLTAFTGWSSERCPGIGSNPCFAILMDIAKQPSILNSFQNRNSFHGVSHYHPPQASPQMQERGQISPAGFLRTALAERAEVFGFFTPSLETQSPTFTRSWRAWVPGGLNPKARED